jgi:NitT/TauT family transport system ATP-binding protein
VIPVGLPKPRDQIGTKELSEFARLRAHVYRLIKREQDVEDAQKAKAVPVSGTSV